MSNWDEQLIRFLTNERSIVDDLIAEPHAAETAALGEGYWEGYKAALKGVQAWRANYIHAVNVGDVEMVEVSVNEYDALQEARRPVSWWRRWW